MIAFDLICKNGHKFEGWFENNLEYEEQKRDGLIACPFCETSNINKELSPVGFIKSNRADTSSPQDLSIEGQVKILNENIKKISKYIDKNFEDVGSDFAEKALKIHYGVQEPKNIRGTTTREEEKTLQEEGINFISLPQLSNNEDKQKE